MGQFWPAKPPRILPGTFTGTVNGSGVGVSFPAGFFTATPRVLLPTQAVLLGLNSVNGIAVSSVASTGFVLSCYGTITGTVDWIAIQA